MSNSTYATPAATELALTLCRGSYQRALIMGTETWSGAGLRGRAGQYGARDARSRQALLLRLEACEELQLWRCVEKSHGRKFVTLNLRNEDETPDHPEVRDLW